MAAQMANAMEVPVKEPNQSVSNTSISNVKNVYAVNSSTPFTDVQSGSWYYTNIMNLVDKGVINGYPDGTFKPDGTITRAEFTKLVIAALGSAESLNNGKSWPSNVVAVADNYNINLYGEDVNNWNKPINRADMAQVAMDSLYEIAGKPVAAKPNISNVLKDKKLVESSGRSDAIYEAMSVGILNGNGLDANGYTEYRPAANSKRSEASTIIMNMLKFLGYADGELTPIAIPETPAVANEFPDIIQGSARPDGVTNPEIARQKDIEALEATRCGKDDSGYFVTFTAPDLPQSLKDAGYVYYLCAIPQSKDGLGGCADAWTVLKAGESKKLYFRRSGGTAADVTDSDFGSLTYYSTILKVFGDPTNRDDVTSNRSTETASIKHMISSGHAEALETGEFVGWTSETGRTNSDNNDIPLNTIPIFEGLADILGK